MAHRMLSEAIAVVPHLMLFLIPAGAFVVSLLWALWLVPQVRGFAMNRGWYDAPDGYRKIHVTPIPNVGGIAIMASVLGGLGVLLLTSPWLPEAVASMAPPPLVVLGAVLIALVGFWDDLHDLHFRPKFVAQVIVSALVIASGFRIELFDVALGDGTLALAVSIGLTVVWMVGVMNAVNFIDGMDGLAAGAVALAFAGLAGVYALSGDVGGLLVAAAMAGALLGFLRYNTNPASIFMGDSGSLFLGFMLAAFALRTPTHADPVLAYVIPAVAMGLPVLDTGVAITRRLLRGTSPFAADRDHIHHRLSLRTTHRHTVRLLHALSLFFALGAVAMAAAPPVIAWVLFGAGAASIGGLLYGAVYTPLRTAPRKVHTISGFALPEFSAPVKGDTVPRAVPTLVTEPGRPAERTTHSEPAYSGIQHAQAA